MNPALTHIHDTLTQIRTDIQEDIIGQDTMIEKLIITFFAGGHALLEWVPGLGKTRAIRTFARVLGLDTGRVSFTPDLLPSDLTGNEIYRQQSGKFEVRQWPIFTSILLADEINRTPPKVQSALLEAMEEKRVTIGDKTLDLPSPFVVFATQNPLEHEGTYPLPEAQLDRFLMRIVLQYPTPSDEKQILMQETGTHWFLSSWGTKDLPQEEKWADSSQAHSDSINWKLNPADLIEMIDYIAKSIRVDEKIYDYVGDILSATRNLTTSAPHPVLSYGASTRAGLALIRAGRVRAVMAGRDYMLPEDVQVLAHDIIDHRIGLSYESMSEWVTSYSVTAQILDSVRIP
jgi:MoxR-like ATPase